MPEKIIPFNKAYIAGNELQYIAEAVKAGELKGDGPFTRKCQQWLEEKFGCSKVLLTHSCTAALEMSAILIDIQEGDEVIMPSYTFVSTANAFALRGAKPVFIDIREDTLNLDERLIEKAITKKTKAICPMHYAGVGCEMKTILEIAKQNNLKVIEDSAHGIMAKCATKDGEKYLGTIGDIGTFSFHETKNFSSGEGGAILLNDPQYHEKAEIIREKGTNRSKFFRGEVDKYTWVDLGSSYLPSEIIAAFLYGQLEKAEEITKKRHDIWQRYWNLLSPLAEKGICKLPFTPENCAHNAHMFYLILDNQEQRDDLIAHLYSKRIGGVFHYVPLHTSPMGTRYGYKQGDFPITEKISETIIRLPLYYELTVEDQERVCREIEIYFAK